MAFKQGNGYIMIMQDNTIINTLCLTKQPIIWSFGSYKITCVPVSATHVSINVIYTQNKQKQREATIRSFNQQHNKLKLALENTIAEIKAYTAEIAQVSCFEKAIEESGRTIVTLLHTQEKLKLEISTLEQTETTSFEVIQDIYNYTVRCGTLIKIRKLTMCPVIFNNTCEQKTASLNEQMNIQYIGCGFVNRPTISIGMQVHTLDFGGSGLAIVTEVNDNRNEYTIKFQDGHLEIVPRHFLF